MTGYKLVYLFLGLLFVLANQSVLFGQGRIHYDQIKKEDGSQLGHVFDVFEDHSGFLWFCTNQGLAKYDGYTFEFFLHQEDDINTPSATWTYAGLSDSKGRIWAGTNNGLNLLEPKMKAFKRFHQDQNDTTSLLGIRIRDIFEDSKGHIWIGSYDGICLYNEDQQNFQRIHAPNFRGHRHGANIFEDSNSNLWVTSTKGLYKIDPATLSAQQMLPIDSLQSLDTYFTTECYEDAKGIFWITTNKGVWLFNPSTSDYVQLDLPEDMIDKSYSQLLEYPKGNLMIGSFDIGLINWNLTKNEYHQLYSHSLYKTGGLTVNSTYSLFVDSRKNLWVGLFHGVNKVNLNGTNFQLYQNVAGVNDLRNYILRVYGDPYGGVWINTMGGLFYRQQLDQKPVSITGDLLNEKEYYGIGNFSMDSDRKIWFGLRREGLFNCNIKTKEITKIDEFGKSENFINLQVLCDNNNSEIIWVSCQSGLFRYNQRENKGKWFYPQNDLPNLSNNSLGKLIEGENGDLRIVKNNVNSILFFDKTKGIFEQHTLLSDETTTSTNIVDIIYKKQQLWVATRNTLNLYHPGNRVFETFTIADGLDKEGIEAMQIDESGHFWFSQNGITKYMMSSGKSQNFKISHQAEDLIYGFSSHTADGVLLYPSTNGILAFRPKMVVVDSVPPKIMLRSIKVNNEPVKSLLASEFIDNLILTWNDKILTFEYAGLKYNKQRGIQYKIKLEGFDQAWREMGNKRDATYTNLNPGEYTFKIMSANADGVWTKTPREIHIQVLPPYWQTFWFYGLMSMVVLGVLYALFRNYRYAQKMSREKEVAEQNARYKSLFLANMSHEIRTPMNTILGMNNLMMDTDLTSKQYEYTEIINQSSENLLVIINDILDHSKIESGKYTFKNKPFALDKALSLLQGAFEPQAKDKGLVFTINVAPATPPYLKGDVIRLKQILINLIGNAIKFTEKGAVTLKIKAIKTVEHQVDLLFEITDTGVGIPEELKDRIFESFERGTQSGEKEIAGTGLGLSIANQLVKQQGGSIWLDSMNDSKGSKFSFNLPFEVLDQISIKEKEILKNKIYNKYTFLITEDSLFNQKLLEELLKKYFPNANIEITDNGQKAVDLVRFNNYDLVFMDVKMPVMNGFEATKKIRTLADLKKQQTKIIAVTANAIPSQLEQCKHVGMNGYITKPIKAEEMLAKIYEILGVLE